VSKARDIYINLALHTKKESTQNRYYVKDYYFARKYEDYNKPFLKIDSLNIPDKSQ
jgi:hypothetical protein